MIEIETYYGNFLSLCSRLFSEHSQGLIRRALSMAVEALDGLQRYDGTPLVGHSVATAEIVAGEVGLGRNSVVAALLHDAARMERVSLAEVNSLFGEAPVGIILGMNDISSINTNGIKSQIDNFRDLIISYSTDPRVILLKLADRLEVMRKIDIFPADKQMRKSWESMNLYAQIAHKLGLYNIKSELEEISFAHIEPKAYGDIRQKLEESAQKREALIADVLAPVEKRMQESGIRYHLKSRTKSVYSIWRKMQKQGVPFEEVFDIFAIRIIIECPREQEKMLCWNVYSIVTDFYTPNPERMRDWISIPKSNGYESLHATVSAFGEWVEFQIRTERMDEVAERGIAAHWRYKGVGGGSISHEEWLARLREIMEESGDSKSQLCEKLDAYATNREVFAFTPKGDIRKLPEGATVLDFAFDIHTSVGSSCVGAKIGDRNVPIKERLRNGDIVTILTSKNQKPKTDWLNIVVTSKARSRIKAFLREEESKLAKLGREELERKLKNWKFAIAIDDAVTLLCKHFKLRTGMELYGRIVDQKVEMAEVKEIITRHLAGEDTPQPIAPPKASAPRKEEQSSEELVLGDEVHGLEWHTARCCNPIFGDEVFGFTTINKGVTIHRTDCPNARRLRELYPYRIIAARWKGETSKGSFIAAIRIVADDRAGLLNNITESIGALGINIRSMALSPMRDGQLGGLVNVEVPSSSVADMVTHNILRINGVKRAFRVNK